MPDFDVTMEFTVPDVDRAGVDAIVEEVASLIIDRTGWNVASRVVESHPSTDNPRRDNDG